MPGLSESLLEKSCTLLVTYTNMKFWEQIGTGRKKCAWRLCYAVQGDLKPYLQFYGTTALFPPLPLCCHAPEGAGVVPGEPLCLQKSEMVQSSLTACLSCSEMEMAVLLPSTTLLWIESQNQLCGAKFLVLAHNCGLGTNF